MGKNTVNFMTHEGMQASRNMVLPSTSLSMHTTPQQLPAVPVWQKKKKKEQLHSLVKDLR
jgi:hypothetical protein